MQRWHNVLIALPTPTLLHPPTSAHEKRHLKAAAAWARCIFHCHLISSTGVLHTKEKCKCSLTALGTLAKRTQIRTSA